mmetsp:Transcript_16682/g.25084  ORF Transcript_16682/g.25084 Transcript_16682/m.25084 type:complete len:373 (-) Transcript_16682:49-1167(-)
MSQIDITFADDMRFSNSYLRNNRNDHLKNLQCFPHCSHKHTERQFCGTSIKVNVTTSRDIPLKDVVWLGQFTAEKLALFPSSTLTRSGFLENRRSATNILGKYYEGVVGVSDQGIITCEFNRELLGWHYGWTSNKHRAMERHVFLVAAYRFSPGSEIGELVGSAYSNPFVLKSARRRLKSASSSSSITKEKVILPTKPQNPAMVTSPPPSNPSKPIVTLGCRSDDSESTTSLNSSCSSNKSKQRSRGKAGGIPTRVPVLSDSEIMAAKERIKQYRERVHGSVFTSTASTTLRRLTSYRSDPVVVNLSSLSRSTPSSLPTRALDCMTISERDVFSIGPAPVTELYSEEAMQRITFDSLFGEGGVSYTSDGEVD